MSEPYVFLFVDVVPKEEHKRFRKGFDTYLIPNDIRSDVQESKTSVSDTETNHGSHT